MDKNFRNMNNLLGRKNEVNDKDFFVIVTSSINQSFIK
jgi:hypothetical protein